jgi:hypothetical protein
MPLIGIGAGLIGKLFDKGISKEERAAAEAFAEAEVARARADMEKLKTQKTLMYVGVAGLVAVVLLKGR